MAAVVKPHAEHPNITVHYKAGRIVMEVDITSASSTAVANLSQAIASCLDIKDQPEKPRRAPQSQSSSRGTKGSRKAHKPAQKPSKGR